MIVSTIFMHVMFEFMVFLMIGFEVRLVVGLYESILLANYYDQISGWYSLISKSAYCSSLLTFSEK